MIDLRGKLKKISRGQEGFTLIEILLVVVIISSLAAMVVPRLTGRSEQARIAIARADIRANLPTALKLYELDNGTFPTTQQGLQALISAPSRAPVPRNWNGPYVEGGSLSDPWGNDYRYRYPPERGVDYDLYSYGPSGVDDDENITNWD